MKITCLGSAACIPEAGNDSSHYLIDDRILLDTGWHAANNLIDFGFSVQNLHTLLFTHTHHDHVMGLPGFLFSYLDQHKTLSTLSVYGPEETDAIVQRAVDYLDLDRFYAGCGRPQIHILHGGEELELSGYTVKTLQAQHPVPALCYRIERGGSAAGFTGDSRFLPEFTDFFAGSRIVFSECSFGVAEPPEEEKDFWGHMNYADAVCCAEKAHRLAIVHLRDSQRWSLPAGTCQPMRGDVIIL